MPAKKTKKKLSLYHLILHEVSAANREQKKPLSLKKQQRLTKNIIETHYQDVPQYKIRKGDLRTTVTSEVKKHTRKKTSGATVYNQVLHEASLINQSVSEEQRLLIGDLRKLVSAIYRTNYKGVSKRKIDWEDVRKKIVSEFRKLKKDICDVLAIPEDVYSQGINYFEIDDFIGDVLPPCIYVAVNAGDWGQTEIFNTKDYNYYDSGVKAITDTLNNAIRNNELPMDTNQNPKYFGEIQLRPGKKNDGNPSSYYLEMVLYIYEESVVEEKEVLKIPKRKKKKSSRERKKQKKVRDYVLNQLKTLKAEKSKVKPIRKKIATLEYEFKGEIKGINRLVRLGVITKEDKQKVINDYFLEQKNFLDQKLKKGILQKYQYAELYKLIKNIFGITKVPTAKKNVVKNATKKTAKKDSKKTKKGKGRK